MTTKTPMSLAELLELPVAVDLVTASRALGIATTTGYDLAKRGEYPVRLIRMGHRFTVPTFEILKELGVDREYIAAALDAPVSRLREQRAS